jgi:hypothetical protein
MTAGIKPVIKLHYRLSRLDPWAIARRFGLHYSGDTNPVDHGGYFYRVTPTTIEDGYAEGFRFVDVEGVTHLESLTINLPDEWEELCRALECVGWDGDDGDLYDIDPLLVTIEAGESYGWAEWDCVACVASDFAKDRDGCVKLTENQMFNLMLQCMGIERGAK